MKRYMIVLFSSLIVSSLIVYIVDREINVFSFGVIVAFAFYWLSFYKHEKKEKSKNG